MRRSVRTITLCTLLALAELASAQLPVTRIVVDPASPPEPWAKQFGDLDRDGYADLIVGAASQGVVWYRYLPASGTFSKHTLSYSSFTESGSAVGDLSGDGFVDVLIGGFWYQNPGAGGSVTAPWSGSNAFGSNHDSRIADIDRDGRLDVAVRSEASTGVNVYFQNSPTSWSSIAVNPGFGLNGLDLVDVDRDGWLDVVTPGRWLRNPGSRTGTWTTYTFGTWGAYAAIDHGDVNGDGRVDLALSESELDNGKVSWFEAPADPTQTSAWLEHPVDAGLHHAHTIYVRDMDLDGRPDLLVSEYTGAGRLIFYRSLSSGSSWQAQTLGTPALHNASVADFDLDGDIDVFGARAFGVNPVELWRNDLDSPAPPIPVFPYEDSARHPRWRDGRARAAPDIGPRADVPRWSPQAAKPRAASRRRAKSIKARSRSPRLPRPAPAAAPGSR